MLNKSEYLLSKLSQEAAEVIQRCTKAQTFGLEEKQEGQDLPNSQRISDEYADLVGVFLMCLEAGVIPPDPEFANKVAAKQKKVLKYMEYSKEKNCLEKE